MDYGKFVFRDFSTKQNIKNILQFNQFLGDEKSHSPNGRVICDLHSPDTFDTRLGERASANVQPCKHEKISEEYKSLSKGVFERPKLMA